MIVAVTGLRREARIVESAGVRAIACGGRKGVLLRELNGALDCRVCGIISFGICAGLSPDLRSGTCVIASEVVGPQGRIPADAAWIMRMRRHLTGAVTGAVAGSDSLLQSRDEKSALFARTGALAADMESHVAGEIAQRHNLAFACLRSVADMWNSDLPHAATVAVRENGTIDLVAVARSVLERPRQIPALMRAAGESRAAFAALFRCRDMLGVGLAGPDLGEPAFDMG